MKEYKVVVFQESSLSSLLLGTANANEVKFSEFLNKHAQAGWRVVTMAKDMRRLFLLWKKESYLIVMEREGS
ncbi:DUF4177 domain-containing protein [Gilliamella mensalis]|uniref:DUF4177 domain-containing protein n=1 Tax=Gilliamella mensalis TaxID=1908520 RepID=UPI000A15DF8E|nr:DUF4177 domain-containing protein [Gilliamella mensalis]